MFAFQNNKGIALRKKILLYGTMEVVVVASRTTTNHHHMPQVKQKYNGENGTCMYKQ